MRDQRSQGDGEAGAERTSADGTPGRRTRTQALASGSAPGSGELRDPLPAWDGPALDGGDDPFGLHLDGGDATPAAAVQRKPDGAAASSDPGDDGDGGDHELVRRQGMAWPVFAASGKPYIVEERDGKPGAWVVRDWIRAAPDATNRGNAWVAPSRARELLISIGEVDPARMDFAAENLTFSFTKRYEYLSIGARARHATGLAPGASAAVDRAPASGLNVLVALDDPSITPGTAHDLTTSELNRAVKSAADYTGLKVVPDGMTFMATQWVRPPLVAGNGVVLVELNRAACRTLFGFDSYNEWAGGSKVKQADPPDPATPKLKLQNFYQGPIPGRLTHYADIVESGESARLEVLVDWPHHFPDAEVYAAPPMVTPSKFSNVAMLQCNWRFDRLSGVLGPALGQATAGAAAAAQPGAASKSDAPASAPASQPDAAAAVAANPGDAQTTSIGEVFHAFHLVPGETQATFRVTCEARFDEYFEPTTFTRDIVVTSGAAAMDKLKSEAFTGLGAAGTDRRGGSWTGELDPGFTASPAAGTGGAAIDPTAGDRRAQRERLELVGDYLRDNPASEEAVTAIDAELARQHRTEELLARDHAQGWQPFQLRGTYLSRTEGLTSGPLDLHGTVRVEMHHDVYPGDGPSTVQRIRDDKYVVQIRDLSRRFEQADFVFEGRADTFHEALRAAFDDLAVAYPKGLVSIEAEDVRGEALRQPDGGPGPLAALGPGTGKALGFQRSTDTTWKQVKATVWDPVAQIVTNLGAIALMTLVPGSTAIVAPALIAYNTVPTVDHVASQAARGTLTAGTLAMSTAEIALNLLPMLSTARPFTAGWLAVETANWGGQVALMGAAAIGMAEQLQSQQVAALAEEYQAFLELQKRSLPSDPDLAIAEARIRDRAAAVDGAISEQFLALVRDNALQMAAGSVIHNTSAHARAAIVDYLHGRTPRADGPDAGVTSAGGPPHDPGTAGPPPIAPRPTADHTGDDAAPTARRSGDDATPVAPPAAEPSHAPTPDPDDPWARSAQQTDALDAARDGDPTRAQRDVLVAELNRQVSTLGLTIAVGEGRANSVVTVVVPGGGPLGIKTLNDDLVGYAINSSIIGPQRNALVDSAFARHGLTMVEQNYKSTTLVSARPIAEIGPSIRAALSEIDAGMRPILERGLREGITSWTRKRAEATPGSDAHNDATKRVEKMRALLPRLHEPDFQFDLHVGAAEVSGGKDASYDQILAAEMNATKAAIMARDPNLKRTADSDLSEPRALAFDESEFLDFARETVAIRDRLDGRTLPWHGEARHVSKGGAVDRDLLRALRKGKLDTKSFTDADRETLALLQQYFTRVNAFDYMKHFKGANIDAVESKVRDAAKLVRELESDHSISRETTEALAHVLRGELPQAGTASEAQFYARAATLGERVVLNADIKDLGLTLFDGYAATMGRVGSSARPDVAKESRTASDDVVELKRKAAQQFATFYRTELVPTALARLTAQGRHDDAKMLEAEREPLILLGGDEITVSLHPLFGDLDLVPEAVAVLIDADVANARVAVTRSSSSYDGATGHATAMKESESGHDRLKLLEQRGRDLRDHAKSLPSALAEQAETLARELSSLYVVNDQGRDEVRDGAGARANLSHLEARASALLNYEVEHE